MHNEYFMMQNVLWCTCTIHNARGIMHVAMFRVPPSSSEMDMDLMPGFKLSWYYTGLEFTPDPLMEFPIFSNNYEYSKYNIDFVRKVFFYEKAFWTQQSALDSSIW